MVMTLIAAVTFGVATGPIFWLARARIVGTRHLLVSGIAATTMSGSALLVGPWALLSLYLRPVIVAALFTALLVAIYRTTRARVRPGTGVDAPRLTWQYAAAFVFSVVLVDALSGRLAPAGTIALDFPLEPGNYAVLQGGNSLALNPFHHWFPSDRHAVDIVKVNAFGNRAGGLAPARLSDYLIFNTTVRSPCAGRVERLENDLPDHGPGEMDWEHPAGNHVLLRCGTVRVLLAHLGRGSVVVSRDESILSGQLVGRVGNSGGTREPHLHLGAMVGDGDETFPTTEAVPVTLGGRYLRINDVVNSTTPQ